MTSANAFLDLINQAKPRTNINSEIEKYTIYQNQSGVWPHKITFLASWTKAAMGFAWQKIRRLSGTALKG